MALFNFESLSFHSLPLTGRIDYGGGVFEVSFPRPFSFVSGELCAIHTGNPKEARLYSIASGSTGSDLSFLFNVVEGGFLTPKLRDASMGETFFISPPFGEFILSSRPAIWMATGTGIVPFLSAVRSGLEVENKRLIQGARFKEGFLGQDLLSSSGISYMRCCSACPELSQEGFYGGRLTEYLKETRFPEAVKVYLCGHSQMIVDVREILVERGVPLDNIICEVYF
jgi:ferredoxin--NADP+ reductase